MPQQVPPRTPPLFIGDVFDHDVFALRERARALEGLGGRINVHF
ncbi:MAG: hypothetical protein ABR972_14790 [Acidimicrobiales bacterium]